MPSRLLRYRNWTKYAGLQGPLNPVKNTSSYPSRSASIHTALKLCNRSETMAVLFPLNVEDIADFGNTEGSGWLGEKVAAAASIARAATNRRPRRRRRSKGPGILSPVSIFLFFFFFFGLFFL